ncbi:MAG: response regulator, partial [bacterium]
RSGLKQIIEEDDDIEVLAEVGDGEKALEVINDKKPEIAILDLDMPKKTGFDVLIELAETKNQVKVIFLTMYKEENLFNEAMDLGIKGYVLKESAADDICECIRLVANDDYAISPLISNFLVKRLSIGNKLKKEKPYSRKLLAIMFTDIKDYSKKMGSDENLAIKLLGIHNEIVKEVVYLYKGKIKEVIGDAYVVSFDSAVKCVECACEIQKKFKSYSEEAVAEEKIEIRIGIHLGDIIEYDNMIIGDAVNIAARIQENAIPGGVTMSESIYFAIRNKVQFNIIFSGEKSFKNIKDPVKIYEVEF